MSLRLLLSWLVVFSLLAGCEDEQIRQLAIGDQPDPDEVSLVGAGWSFGMCGGYCGADLAVNGEGLVLTGRSNMSDAPLYVNRGALTVVARERIDAAVQRLDGMALDAVYGCPDCADGGAAYLTLAQHGATSRHDLEFSRPPDVLAELHGLAMTIVDALETCGSNELVATADDCGSHHPHDNLVPDEGRLAVEVRQDDS